MGIRNVFSLIQPDRIRHELINDVSMVFQHNLPDCYCQTKIADARSSVPVKKQAHEEGASDQRVSLVREVSCRSVLKVFKIIIVIIKGDDLVRPHFSGFSGQHFFAA
jgi:hypothetical protein